MKEVVKMSGNIWHHKLPCEVQDLNSKFDFHQFTYDCHFQDTFDIP